MGIHLKLACLSQKNCDFHNKFMKGNHISLGECIEWVINMVICFLGSYIKQSKYSRVELCEMFGVSQNTLSNWSTGKTYPSIPQLLKLAKLLNVSIDDLYKLKEEE